MRDVRIGLALLANGAGACERRISGGHGRTNATAAINRSVLPGASDHPTSSAGDRHRRRSGTFLVGGRLGPFLPGSLSPKEVQHGQELCVGILVSWRVRTFA